MAEFTDKVLGPVAVKILGWIGAALGGAVLVLLLNSSGQSRQVEQNTQAIAEFRQDIKELKEGYATNKRVDDVQLEMRTNYRDLSAKLDNVIKILLDSRGK